MTNRVSATLLIGIALAVAAYAFMWFAGAALPYQDATPELLHKQAVEMQRATAVLAAALLVALAGATWLWKIRKGRR